MKQVKENKSFLILLLTLFLFSCSKVTPPSTAITETTKKEIQVIQKDIQKSTCDNKESLLLRLENIGQSVENINTACKVEKEVLIEKNNKLSMIITFLILVIGILGYLFIKRK